MSLPLFNTQNLIAYLVSVYVGLFYHLIRLCLKHHLVVTIQSALPFGSSLIYFQGFVLTGGRREKKGEQKGLFLPQGN